MPRHLGQAAVVGTWVDHAVARGVLLRHLHDRQQVALGLALGARPSARGRASRRGSDRRPASPRTARRRPRGARTRPRGPGPWPPAGGCRRRRRPAAPPARAPPAPWSCAFLASVSNSSKARSKWSSMMRLAAPGDEDELLAAGRCRLLQRVLDDRLVDDRQHLLGQHLGRGQHPRAQPGHRKHNLAELSPYLRPRSGSAFAAPMVEALVAGAAATVQPRPWSIRRQPRRRSRWSRARLSWAAR